MEQLTVSVKEAAVLLGVSESHVRNMARRGDVRTVRFGDRILIPREAVVAVMRGYQQEEARLRRLATKQGLQVRKDRARERSLDRQGGYMLVDPDANAIVAGARYNLNLEDLEQFLTEAEA